MTKIRVGQISSGSATVGQVATADGAGGVSWEDPTGEAVGTYRQFTYVPDGAGSFAFVVDEDGMPIFARLELE
jgi:hypothetical protein